MAESSEEKTEDATPKKLREARDKGQVAKSKDVSQVFVLVTMFTTIALMFRFIGVSARNYFTLCFQSLSQSTVDGPLLWELGKEGFMLFLLIFGPMALVGVIVGYVSGFLQVGAIFAIDPLIPKFEKLNPVEGLKNMFKAQTFIELIKNIIKIAIVFYLAYTAIAKSISDVVLTATIPLMDAASITGEIIFEFIVKVCLAFMVISVIDYMVQRWNFMKQMRMSKDEVKREYKQDEGDPMIKGERKRLHREYAMSDAKGAMKKADAVVTNPTSVACVLEYKRDEMSAPCLTLKGQDDFAEFIVELAREEGVPVIRNIPLAWSLLRLEIGDEIPEELFEVVAEVLAFVYRTKPKNEQDQNSDDDVSNAEGVLL
jgi:flagellar biosynthetic protein FlhB